MHVDAYLKIRSLSAVWAAEGRVPVSEISGCGCAGFYVNSVRYAVDTIDPCTVEPNDTR